MHVIRFPTDSEFDESAVPFQGVSRNVLFASVVMFYFCDSLETMDAEWSRFQVGGMKASLQRPIF
jgi:hypothetical protein